MHSYLGSRDEPDALPDWDVYACDAFGRPSILLGGIMSMAATANDALEMATAFYPEHAIRAASCGAIDDRASVAASRVSVSGAGVARSVVPHAAHARPPRPSTHRA